MNVFQCTYIAVRQFKRFKLFVSLNKFFLQILQRLLSLRQALHVAHHPLQVLLAPLVLAVGVRQAGDGDDEQARQDDVLCCRRRISRRSEEHNVHGLQGNLRPVDRVCHPEDLGQER